MGTGASGAAHYSCMGHCRLGMGLGMGLGPTATTPAAPAPAATATTARTQPTRIQPAADRAANFGTSAAAAACAEWDGRVPREKVSVSASRSGGAGGQNVNKVSTKIELRFVVQEAIWLPERVRQRMVQLNRNRITKTGELVLTSQREH